jgi:hypothetical protein
MPSTTVFVMIDWGDQCINSVIAQSSARRQAR